MLMFNTYVELPKGIMEIYHILIFIRPLGLLQIYAGFFCVHAALVLVKKQPTLCVQ